jgi:hypothetical protein
MRCEEAETRLLELVDEELPSERRVEALSHLQACTSCATEFSAYQNLLALVQADAVPEPSPRFWEEFLPSLKHHIQQEAFDSKQESTGWLAGLRSWFVFSRPFIAGVAVAAVSILIVIRLPGFLPVGPDRHDTPPAKEQSASRESGSGSVAMSPNTDDVKRRSGEPYVLAGEVVDDPSALAAAIQRLPWVNEIADRIETAWVQHPESDPAEWIASLSEEEHQILLDRLRSFRWSQS